MTKVIMLAINNVEKAWTPFVISNTPKLGFKNTRSLHAHKFNNFGVKHKWSVNVQKQDSEWEWEYKLIHLKIRKTPNPKVGGF
jgi:hypothetical protein